MHSFNQSVYNMVEKIPYGRVVSYGQIAHALGKPQGARAVGWAMRNCPEHLPWQRVVKADGAITGGEHAALRKSRLADEGVEFLPDGRVDMSRFVHFL